MANRHSDGRLAFLIVVTSAQRRPETFTARPIIAGRSSKWPPHES